MYPHPKIHLTWISNHTHYKMQDEITYPFPNFTGANTEVWEWISNFITHFNWTCDYLSMLGLKLIQMLVKGGVITGQIDLHENRFSLCQKPSFANNESVLASVHVDVMTWKRFLCYWPFVRGIHVGLVPITKGRYVVSMNKPSNV